MSTELAQNLLSNESSPYLLQHKDNPVWWQPWGAGAFERARRENKPIFLSIGYSTCYWCHVMEQDSFERQDVADLLNRDFVAIKVDREERPDIDQIYMDFVSGLTGRGGWPMSVFLTPDLQPFWGGTFFYRDQFKQILAALADAWINRQAEIKESVASVAETLRQEIGLPPASIGAQQVAEKLIQAARHEFDSQHGGFGEAPKFPAATLLRTLLIVARGEKDQSQAAAAREMCQLSFSKMARGGIFDQLGGGFHRYSTDERWLVPHFEKMLYDNALLARAYLDASQALKSEYFAAVAKRTLDYICREMQSPFGGFYSAQDAGPVGREGEYYLWPFAELERALDQAELELASRAFGCAAQGNFEGKNVLTFNLDEAAYTDSELAKLTKKLLTIRAERVAPHLDTKIIVAWNGLALSALARGYQVLRDESYLTAAVRCASFLQSQLWRAGELSRTFSGERACHAATLEDFVYLIEGLLFLFEASQDSRWLTWAAELQARQESLFSDASSAGYFSSAADDLIVRKKYPLDGATPAASGVTYENLSKLQRLLGGAEYGERAKALAQYYSGLVEAAPLGVVSLISGLAVEALGACEILLLEGNADLESALEAKLSQLYLPEAIFLKAKSEIAKLVPRVRVILQKSGQAAHGKLLVCSEQSCIGNLSSPEELEMFFAAHRT